MAWLAGDSRVKELVCVFLNGSEFLRAEFPFVAAVGVSVRN